MHTPTDPVAAFNAERSAQNESVLALNDKILKRIFNLDANAYREGALPVATKELIGLSCSLVLRCDDCVRYHLQTCYELGLSKQEVTEAMSIANLIGGTIVIPHLRRAVAFWEALENSPEVRPTKKPHA